MTDVTPNPNARYERLLKRAQEAHELVLRLAEDLREAEGKQSATNAEEDLSALCLKLEGLSNAGQ